MITRTCDGLSITTSTTTMKIQGAKIVSIQDAGTHEEYMDALNTVPALELVHRSGEVFPLGSHPGHTLAYRLLGDDIAEILIEDWECDITVRITTDPENGDILIDPSVYGLQRGMAGLKLNLPGLRGDLMLVAPLQQGVRLDLAGKLAQGKRFTWPNSWEAGLAILEGRDGGLSLQTWDDRYIFKALHVGHKQCVRTVSLESCAYGPLETSQAVGNVCWRISAYRGDWKVPAARYRHWLWHACRMDEKMALRPDWLQDLRLAVAWCPTDLDLLDALAKKADPKTVSLHLPHWRPYEYDEDYPAFTADEAGGAFIRKARQMGYHVMPHCNSCQMSPEHPFYQACRDFVTRDPVTQRMGGWSWMEGPRGFTSYGPPQGNGLITARNGWKILVNVHLGWSRWRRELAWQIAGVRRELGLDSVFVDVSLLIHNSDLAIVEGLTYAEGSLQTLKELTDLAPGFAVGGEGLNEITAQYLSLAQFHLPFFAHGWAAGEDVSWLGDAVVPVNQFLFKGTAAGTGYSYGHDPDARRVRIDASMAQGALPTLIFNGEKGTPAEQLDQEECRYILSRM